MYIVKIADKENVRKVMSVLLMMMIATVSLVVTGCSTTHQAVADPDFAPIRPLSARPLPVNDGSIYKAGFEVSLFQDTRAHRVGDIITIILRENTNASKKASLICGKGLPDNFS